ncbi:hypothetical protein G6F56_014214 [Rhizopus delemar]|nr:hypothetical protein G6F56_014214 [Rhizopus delemar]
MRAAFAVAQAALFGIHSGNRDAGMQLPCAVPRFIQQREQRAALHAQPMQARVQAVVAHVHHRALARRPSATAPAGHWAAAGSLRRPAPAWARARKCPPHDHHG